MQLASQMQKDGSELVDCSRHSDIEYSDLKATNRSEFDRKSGDAINDRKCTPTGSWEVASMEQKVFNQFALRSLRHDLRSLIVHTNSAMVHALPPWPLSIV